jgi:alpha-D-ribose 1-methylphosphonate 5-triphosphate synthase subunit PhnG
MTETDKVIARQRWMALAAKAKPEALAALLPDLPAHALLRRPEVGTAPCSWPMAL